MNSLKEKYESTIKGELKSSLYIVWTNLVKKFIKSIKLYFDDLFIDFSMTSTSDRFIRSLEITLLFVSILIIFCWEIK